jgi:hypothetical protein
MILGVVVLTGPVRVSVLYTLECNLIFILMNDKAPAVFSKKKTLTVKQHIIDNQPNTLGCTYYSILNH